jgi:alkaline phosphatase D
MRAVTHDRIRTTVSMWNRRQLLKFGGSAVACVGAPGILRAAAGQTRWRHFPFTLGVASGAPAADGFVAWTRLAPNPLSSDPLEPGGLSGGDIPLRYEVAEEPEMRQPVASGTALAEARFAHSVHRQVDGLKPGRDYWYRFISGNATSRIGHARTLAAPQTEVSALLTGFVSCSNYEQGYFAAYRHLADEHPAFVIYLGDYIYESCDRNSRDLVRSHSDGREARDLHGYRNRYAQYQLDTDLARLRAASTSLVIWDDHEVSNDYGDLLSREFVEPGEFARRRAAAYQAYYEHMPITPLRTPDGLSLRIYDRFRYGKLAEIHLTDARQYRSAAACHAPPNNLPGRMITDTECPERLQEQRSILGASQEQWLQAGLAKSTSRWNVLAQSLLMAQMRRRNGAGEAIYWTDDWNGYPASRTRLLRTLHEARVRNVLVLSGDIHSYWANDLKLDFSDPASPTVATEFVGTSVSAHGPSFDFAAALPENPHVRFFDPSQRGYATLRLSPQLAEVRFRAISDPRDVNASVQTVRHFFVQGGRPGVAD